MSARPLVVRCGAFGDVVLATTLIRLVAARHGSRVDVVGQGGWTAPLLRHEPALGELHVLTSRNAPYWFDPSQRALVRWLKQRGRGPVYFCDGGGKVLDLLRRAGIPETDIVQRLRSDDEHEDGSPRLWPDRWLRMGSRDPAAFPAAHAVDPAPYRFPILGLSDADHAEMAQWKSTAGLGDTIVLFQPGNKRTHKRGKLLTENHPKHWPAENWAAVAQAVWRRLPQAHVVLCGSPAEHAVLEDIRLAAGRDPRLFNLANDLPIPRLLALEELAHSMVSVDTGPAHAAAALGCPLLVMFGGVSPQKWQPIGPGPIRVLGDEAHWVRDIPAQAVVEAWQSLPERAR